MSELIEKQAVTEKGEVLCWGVLASNVRHYFGLPPGTPVRCVRQGEYDPIPEGVPNANPQACGGLTLYAVPVKYIEKQKRVLTTGQLNDPDAVYNLLLAAVLDGDKESVSGTLRGLYHHMCNGGEPPQDGFNRVHEAFTRRLFDLAREAGVPDSITTAVYDHTGS